MRLTPQLPGDYPGDLVEINGSEEEHCEDAAAKKEPEQFSPWLLWDCPRTGRAGSYRFGENGRPRCTRGKDGIDTTCKEGKIHGHGLLCVLAHDRTANVCPAPMRSCTPDRQKRLGMRRVARRGSRCATGKIFMRGVEISSRARRKNPWACCSIRDLQRWENCCRYCKPMWRPTFGVSKTAVPFFSRRHSRIAASPVAGYQRLNTPLIPHSYPPSKRVRNPTRTLLTFESLDCEIAQRHREVVLRSREREPDDDLGRDCNSKP